MNQPSARRIPSEAFCCESVLTCLKPKVNLVFSDPLGKSVFDLAQLDGVSLLKGVKEVFRFSYNHGSGLRDLSRGW